MKAALFGCCLLAFADKGFAHRLDEYLQATRIDVGTNRIDFTFELTPGVAVAGQVLERIDRDRDERVSEGESHAYARRFLKDLGIRVDGKVLAPHVTSVSFPALRDVRNGIGIIRIWATSSVGPLASGSHALTLTNGHLPALSVYLVNALRSRDPAAVEIGRQTRDELQKEYRLEFRVRPAHP